MSKTIQFPDDLQSMPVFIVKRDSPAFEFLRRHCRHDSIKPGAILPASDEEFRSFREDVLIIDATEQAA